MPAEGRLRMHRQMPAGGFMPPAGGYVMNGEQVSA